MTEMPSQQGLPEDPFSADETRAVVASHEYDQATLNAAEAAIGAGRENLNNETHVLNEAAGVLEAVDDPEAHMQQAADAERRAINAATHIVAGEERQVLTEMTNAGNAAPPRPTNDYLPAPRHP